MRVKGTIGSKGMKPRKTISKDGKSFARFSIWATVQAGAQVLNPHTGQMEQPSKVVQVKLPDNPARQKVFDSLEPGRQVEVEGLLSSNPRMKLDKTDLENVFEEYKTGRIDSEQAVSLLEEKAKVYENLTIKMTEPLTFLDSPVRYQAERLSKLLVNSGAEINGSPINDDTAKEITNAVNLFLAAKQETNGPPREVEDYRVASDSDDETGF